MEASQILCYVAAYAIFLLLQAIFINGVKISASGDTLKSPSGADIDSEMILYPLYKFLTQHTYVKVYYSGEEFLNLYTRINKTIQTDFRHFGDYAIVTNMDSAAFEAVMKHVNILIDPDIKYDIDVVDRVLMYKLEKKFRFSKYIRKPIIQCVICMASFWGFFTYWPVIYFIFGLNYFTFILWIANTICLSYVNFFIFKAHK